MASALYSEDLTCSVCLNIFTDPVILACGHSFCRECITLCLSTLDQCPQCRASVQVDDKRLLTNHNLKSLAEKTKEAEKLKKEAAESLCDEHEEKLKLFCVTDQQLACIICRDGEKHAGHKLKPINEVVQSLRKELETFEKHVSDDIHGLEEIVNRQKEEVTQTKQKAQQLMSQISSQFEEMHQFLRRREAEIQAELKHAEEDVVNSMTENIGATEAALSESRELQGKATSVLNITDTERFLKSYTESKSLVTAMGKLKPRGENLKVVSPPLSLGPYESHLQFFVWKQMLQVIQPRAEQLSLQNSDSNIRVSDDGRSLICQLQNTHYVQPTYYGYQNTMNQSFYSETSYSSALSVNKFASEQHYWEVEVGQRKYWEVGVQSCFLKYDGQSFTVNGHQTKQLPIAKPGKIGVYINCSSKKVSFYDADTMTHVHTSGAGIMSLPASAYFNLQSTQSDHNPVTVCWY